MNALKQPIRFLSIFAFVLSAVLLGNGGTAAAANPLLCFSGTTDPGGFHGTCALVAGGAMLLCAGILTYHLVTATPWARLPGWSWPHVGR